MKEVTAGTPGQAAYEAAVRVMLDGDTAADRVPDDGPDFAWDAIGSLERDSWEAAAQAAVAAQQPQPAPELADDNVRLAVIAQLRDFTGCPADDGEDCRTCDLRAAAIIDAIREAYGKPEPETAPELAAARAESRKLRGIIGYLLEFFGEPDHRNMRHASVTKSTIARYAAEAGVKP